MSVTLVTPTYGRDYERFLLQRESIERCGIDVPHLAVIDTEDLQRFRDMPFQRNLTLISSQELLGRRMDQRRRVWGVRRRHYRYWITGKRIHGWSAQQLMKLASVNVVKTDAVVCLDSDTFFVDRVSAGDFYAADGRLHLYTTTDDVDVQMGEWYAHSLRLFNIDECGLPFHRFTHSPVPMKCDIVREMLAWLEKTQKMSWMDVFVKRSRIMEYTTYGTYAFHVDACRRVYPIPPPLTLYYWWKTDGPLTLNGFMSRLHQTRARMVLINSNMGNPVESYREMAAQAWSALHSVVQAS